LHQLKKTVTNLGGAGVREEIQLKKDALNKKHRDNHTYIAVGHVLSIAIKEICYEEKYVYGVTLNHVAQETNTFYASLDTDTKGYLFFAYGGVKWYRKHFDFRMKAPAIPPGYREKSKDQ
jgi:hypothetical protein